MTQLLPDETARFVSAAGPQPDDVLAEMDEYAHEHGFPHVGPEVGGWLQLLARMVEAERVFEFGSGYGYSAYWFARALPDDGEIVLTEFDADELELAREYLRRGGFDSMTTYEHGDAIETVERYDGPFDVVLVDVRKDQYPDAFEAVREKVAPGGIIVADNAMTAGTLDFEGLLAVQEGADPSDLDDQTRGIADYLQATRDAPEFTTAVMPVGEGIAVSYRSE
ncbi:O-methyltransferase [Natranaeroarchaeum aerophilus]|uniref:O-methyltransferase n=1 Tax=Natranaeroarchaeum aerophilus TaxID=2917711 RepID=A0AAE3FTI6_9EURY|nr:O-methyltransferase [Natranaeroarchaeum aerophilus]MCL9815049.1 O-methyltransferase [Natranaeroarchaeum aerophilus]